MVDIAGDSGAPAAKVTFALALPLGLLNASSWSGRNPRFVFLVLAVEEPGRWRVTMASEDDCETVEGGNDEDLRLCGLAGEDDDDLGDGREALFGNSADEPIVVGDEEEQAAEDDKPAHPSTSVVWLNITKIFKMVKGKKVRWDAKCNHCEKQYSARSSGGTCHLARHRDACPKRREKSRMAQSQISFNPDGSLRNWEYSPQAIYKLHA